MALRHISTTTTTILLLLLLLLLKPFSYIAFAAATDGLFIFGSSLVDNGNNNFLPNTTAKANYPPYGIDSSMGPSGRFSNGKNVVDALGECLGLPQPIPPFLDPKTRGHAIIHGVNFASGGSGILDQTGSIGGRVISLKEQIANFEMATLPELKEVLGRGGRGRCGGRSVDLSKYMFVVGTGGNDYLLNFYMKAKGDGSAGLVTFTNDLITTLYTHLKKLHRLGARKFILMSVQAIGCSPVVMRFSEKSTSCVETINEAALLFNSHLRSLVDSAAAQMPGSHLVYVNSYDLIRDLIHSPAQKGFRETRKACCEVDWKNGILCREGGKTCGDREGHVFFDGLHPTEAVNLWVAKMAYQSKNRRDVYPVSIKQLAEI